MSNDVSFKRADYIEALERWATVRDVCAGQHRVVSRLPYINAHDKSPENIDRNKSYRERAVFKTPPATHAMACWAWPSTKTRR